MLRGMLQRNVLRGFKNNSRLFSSQTRTLDSLTEQDLRGKNVLVRVDFNVPVNKETGVISDDTRIKEALPSIKYLIEQGAKVILTSHMGRPKGQVVENLRLTGVAARLSELLGMYAYQSHDNETKVLVYIYIYIYILESQTV